MSLDAKAQVPATAARIPAADADSEIEIAVLAVASNWKVAKEDTTSDKPLSPEIQHLQELYEVMLEKSLDSLELKDEDSRIKLTRRFAGVASGGQAHHALPPHPARPGAGAAASVADTASVPSDQVIPTPLAGVFYRASSPNSAPFVKEGDVVDPGQTLCIVEAMKVMNEIKAETRCRIVKIVAENGRPLTAGQALFHIEPA